MLKGISTNKSCTACAPCFSKNEISFVFRYYSQHTASREKNLDVLEARELAKNNIAIAVVYEDNAKTANDLNLNRGHLDAKFALQKATELQQPRNSAMYFAVDDDVGEKFVIDNVKPYFEGIRAEMAHLPGSPPIYRIGVYGSGLVCRFIKHHFGLADFSWLAESTKWAESGTYKEWDVKQFSNDGVKLCEMTTDDWEACTAQADFGQFLIPSTIHP